MIDFNSHLTQSNHEIDIAELQASIFDLERLYKSLGFEGAVLTDFKESYLSYNLESTLTWKCFIQCKSFNPNETTWDSHLHKANFEIIGIKIHPRNMGWVPSVEELVFALKNSVEHDRLTYICTYLPVGPGLSGSFELLGRIADAIAQVPTAKIILGHAGVADLLSASELARRFNSVFLDISFLITRMQGTSVMFDLTWLFKTLDTRILFGSDHPDQNLTTSLQTFREMSRGLSDGKINNIIRQNAIGLAGFFR